MMVAIEGPSRLLDHAVPVRRIGETVETKKAASDNLNR